MFKSLELTGFKSFADKTRFEFSDGITIVVGPNGSGKSNVVDSIKWVLGEQKVKSLRGKEMTDVIFAGAPGRKPMNTAEVTLTFDNSDGRFHFDASELQITRRVMRSGESEYLINRQTCRLKDIREVLAGTGIGTQAYCIIEQGRVDALLQSSPKERRAIFEEAAGVSRYNAMVHDSLKAMERTNFNLNRFKDIVTEQEGRLKSLKRQAEKAARYSEYTHR
ncbi:MAG: AAA family ATPase, partial [Thermoguttaceae bacterium]|nr:AAA family ATPase [Thermoguttaceae bacterium]